ncbi:MAG: hypothetical protein MJ149_00595, partial [Clostridia bacterium]|nr:hypothetical protein [Clostridia bacterium]
MKMKDFDISMTQYNRGDIITGTIVMIGEKEVVVALGGLKEGVFPKEELEPNFKLGSAILVMVTGDVDDKGCLVLNHAGVNKALEDKEKLKNLRVGSEFSFVASQISTAGVNGNFMGYRVFLPFSQCAAKDFANKNDLVNREITAIVIELNNIKKSIVCSTKLLENTSVEPVEIGQEVEGTPIKIEDKYAIIALATGAKAKLSITDASYEYIDDLKEFLDANKTYTFKVLEFNTDYSRISVGLKQMGANPIDEVYKSLHLGDVVEGEVVKILPV